MARIAAAATPNDSVSSRTLVMLCLVRGRTRDVLRSHALEELGPTIGRCWLDRRVPPLAKLVRDVAPHGHDDGHQERDQEDGRQQRVEAHQILPARSSFPQVIFTFANCSTAAHSLATSTMVMKKNR